TGVSLAYLFKLRIFPEENFYLVLLFVLILSVSLIYLKLQPLFFNKKLFVIYITLVLLSGFVRYEQKLSNSSNEELKLIFGNLTETNVSLYGSVIEQPELTDAYVRLLIN